MTVPCILPTAYWAPVQYYTKFLLHSPVTVEHCETYPKQTYRNRCELYGPNGRQQIQVPVARGSFHKVAINNLQITYDTNWQKNHLKTIESAYRSSPFYEYYFDDVLEIYENRYERLLDLNAKILDVTFQWLNLDLKPDLTTEYFHQFNGADYRDLIHPKKENLDINFFAQTYMQGFEQQHGFIPNLSILDVVFNLGPEAITLIKNSVR